MKSGASGPSGGGFCVSAGASDGVSGTEDGCVEEAGAGAVDWVEPVSCTTVVVVVSGVAVAQAAASSPSARSIENRFIGGTVPTGYRYSGDSESC